MANNDHLKMINQGAEAWNAWRIKNLGLTPDLSGADLSRPDPSDNELARADLSNTDLRGASLKMSNLCFARLSHANLCNADLSEAMLGWADLSYAKLHGTRLSGTSLKAAIFRGADLSDADLKFANLALANFGEADLSNADLRLALLDKADFSGTILSGANLTNASIGWTTFSNNDLSNVKGLETVRHVAPSTIGVDTLFKSDGKIPEVFLRGAGVPEDFITFVPSLVGRAIEFYSCFISYSHRDQEFSQRLHSRMRSEDLRVWYAPEDMKGGKKLHEEIFDAIQIHDKVLLVLSEDSMKSEWVTTEVQRAKKVEREENRRKLFPIRLVHFEAIQKWECFDADSGKDLAVELREYYIPDFSNWKVHDTFETEFAKLLRDLKPKNREV